MKLKTLIVVSLLCLLNACSGGTDGGVRDKTFVNPIAKAAALANNVVIVGEEVTFRDGGSSDPDVEPGGFITYSWDFGDGNSAKGPTVEHSYSAAGLYTAVLKVTDGDLLFNETEVKLRVAARRVDIAGDLIVVAGGGNQRFTRDADIQDDDNNTSNNTELNAQYIEAPVVISGYVTSANAVLDNFLDNNEQTFEQLLSGAEGIFAGLLGNIPALFTAILDILQVLTGASLNDGFDDYDYYQVTLDANQIISLNTLAYEEGKTQFSLALIPLVGVQAPIITRGEAALEAITVPESGDYYLVVCPVKGRGKYLLDVDGAQDIGNIASSAVNTSNMVSGQAIVQYKNALAQGPKLEQFSTQARHALSSVTAPVPSSSCYQRLAINFSQYYDKLKTVDEIHRIKSSADVAWAEPNFKRQISAESSAVAGVCPTPAIASNNPPPIINDPCYSNQRHLNGLNAESIWGLGTGVDSIVAVIDNGFKLDHEDLSGQFLPGYDFIANDTFSADGEPGIDNNPSDPGIKSANDQEPNWHGTFIAGVIAAKANNNLGGAGLSYNSKIMPLRAIAGEFGYSYDIIQAMRYAAGLPNDSGTLPVQAADIINMSFGSKDFSRAEQELVNELRRMGIFVVAAAGNNKSSIKEYPAAYDNVLAVGAVNLSGEITVYSKSANWVNLYAFGGIFNPLDTENLDLILSTSSDNTGVESQYNRLLGTSIASAQISALIAVMKEIYPGLKPGHFDQLEQSEVILRPIPPSPTAPAPFVIHGLEAANQAQALANGSLVLQPWVLASPPLANIGPLTQTKLLELVPQVSPSFSVSGVSADESWASAQMQGQNLLISVDSAGLTLGFVHEAVVTVTFDGAEDLLIPIAYKAATVSLGEIPRIYFKLWDLELDRPLVIEVKHSNGSEYPRGTDHSFKLKGVPEGRYCLYYSSDIDASPSILCDVGEFCGAFGDLLQQPKELNVDQHFTDLKNTDNSALKLDLLTPKKLPTAVNFAQCQP